MFPHQHAEDEQTGGGIPSLVKEEPPDVETVFKREVYEGSLPAHREGQQGAEYQHNEEPAKKVNSARAASWPFC